MCLQRAAHKRARRAPRRFGAAGVVRWRQLVVQRQEAGVDVRLIPEYVEPRARDAARFQRVQQDLLVRGAGCPGCPVEATRFNIEIREPLVQSRVAAAPQNFRRAEGMDVRGWGAWRRRSQMVPVTVSLTPYRAIERWSARSW